MEGLGFGCDGTLWGITGNKTIPEHTDRLWEIDKNRAEVSNPRVLDNGTDYEAVTCGFFSPPTPATLILESGDYDGDGSIDPGIFRVSSCLWALRNISRFYFAGDYLPIALIPGDYDGDGKADPIYLDTATGEWHVKLSASGYGAASISSGYSP